MNRPDPSVAKALRDTLVSPNELDRNGEPANVVDGFYRIHEGLLAVAGAIDQLSRNLAELGVLTGRLGKLVNHLDDVWRSLPSKDN